MAVAGGLMVALALGFGAVAPAQAQAIVIAYKVPAGTVGNQNFGGALGMDFDVTYPITVTDLGVFDSNGDGLAVPISARLYDRDTGLLVPGGSISFGIGNGGLEGGSRFLPLPSPITLGAGFHGTIVASGYGLTELNGNKFSNPGPWTTVCGGSVIAFVGRSRYSFTADVFPTTLDGNVDQYAAGTFKFFANTSTPFVLLTYTAGANGTISGVTPQSITYGASGTEVRAVPNAGFFFSSWSDGVTTAARTDLSITCNIVATATFAALPTCQNDPTVNLPVCTEDGSKGLVMGTSDGAGGAIFVWRDSRLDNPGNYAQHVLNDATIDPGWPLNGTAVFSSLSFCRLESDGAGGALLVAGGIGLPVTVQHLLSTGVVDPDWPAGGIVLSTGTAVGLVRTVSDGAGAMIVAWGERRLPATTPAIYAQRIAFPGVDPAWPANGLQVSPAVAGHNKNNPVLCQDLAGGAFVAWRDVPTAGGSTNSDIYAQHVLNQGSVDPSWATNGIAVCTATGAQGFDLSTPTVSRVLSFSASASGNEIISDGAGGCIVTWSDFRTAGNGIDVYAQHLTPSGSSAWAPNGIPLATTTGDEFIPLLTPDGQGGAIATWTNVTSLNTLALHLRGDGSLEGPLTLSTTLASGDYAVSETDGAGGAIVSWSDSRNVASGLDMYAQHVVTQPAFGLDPGWPIVGVALSSALGDQGSPGMVSDGGGGAITAWEDSRSGTNFDIYAQGVSYCGNLAPKIRVLYPGGSNVANGGMADFPIVDVGQSANLTFTIQNIGDADLTGLGITIDGPDAAQFGVTTSPTAPVAGPSGSTAFTVTFTPTSAGAKTAALYIASNDATDSPFTINLTNGGVVGVGNGAAVAFALEGARPNPATGDGLNVAFALPNGVPARLELTDVAGRRVAAREVGSLGAGRHTVNLAEARKVRSGIYWVRLTQGANQLTTRVAVVQ